MVESIDNITDVIANASLTDKAELYKELGIELTYQPDGRLLVEARPRRLSVCVGGPFTPGHRCMHLADGASSRPVDQPVRRTWGGSLGHTPEC